MAGKMTRSGNQGAGIESGVTKKEKIGDYVPRAQDEKTGRPRSPETTKHGEYKIK